MFRERLWQVESPCPQCGGPVVLSESDRLLTCDFCRVRLYVGSNGPLRYCLTPRHQSVDDLVMVPYWRVRGTRFQSVAASVRNGILDLTRLACTAPGLPATLGVRPQAVKLRFAAASLAGRFLPTNGGAPEAPGLPLADGEVSFCDISLASTVSIVYLPVRLTSVVLDALVNRRLGTMRADRWQATVGNGNDVPDPVQFVPTLCPRCSWQLEGEKNTLVLLCRLCGSAWQAAGRRLEPIGYDVVAASGWTADILVPIWQVRARVTGETLESWADLARFANLPTLVRPEWEARPLAFRIPAFPTHPEQFLKLARVMTLASGPRDDGALVAEVDGRTRIGRVPAGPVTLPASALDNAVRALLADLAQPKRTFFPRLGEIRIDVTGANLVYLPLEAHGTEFLYPGTAIKLHRKLLRSAE